MKIRCLCFLGGAVSLKFLEGLAGKGVREGLVVFGFSVTKSRKVGDSIFLEEGDKRL